MFGQSRKYNLLRGVSVEEREVFILVSRKHRSLLKTIRSRDGVTVTELTRFPGEEEVETPDKDQKVRKERNERVFSRKQKEIKNRKGRKQESFASSKTSICGIPIHEIQEWAHFLSKGEFLALYNLTHREFNSAVLALDTEVRIFFTYTCKEKGCGQVFGGDDSLVAFRKHLLQTRHRKGGE